MNGVTEIKHRDYYKYPDVKITNDDRSMEEIAGQGYAVVCQLNEILSCNDFFRNTNISI